MLFSDIFQLIDLVSRLLIGMSSIVIDYLLASTKLEGGGGEQSEIIWTE